MLALMSMEVRKSFSNVSISIMVYRWQKIQFQSRTIGGKPDHGGFYSVTAGCHNELMNKPRIGFSGSRLSVVAVKSANQSQLATALTYNKLSVEMGRCFPLSTSYPQSVLSFSNSASVCSFVSQGQCSTSEPATRVELIESFGLSGCHLGEEYSAFFTNRTVSTLIVCSWN